MCITVCIACDPTCRPSSKVQKPCITAPQILDFDAMCDSLDYNELYAQGKCSSVEKQCIIGLDIQAWWCSSHQGTVGCCYTSLYT